MTSRKLIVCDHMASFESEDSTDKQYDQIAKLKAEIKSDAQKPYVMSDRERELYRQVQSSLRRIGRSQMTFDRINEEIKSHDKLRLIEQQNKNHREQRRLQNMVKSKEAAEALESGNKPSISASKV